MTPTRTCTRCLDRPAADGLGWCRGCRHRIDRDLGDLPALAVDLADTMARVSGAKTGDHRNGNAADGDTQPAAVTYAGYVPLSNPELRGPMEVWT